MLPMRQCGAAARMMLEAGRGKRWGVAASDVEAKNHEVVHKSTGKNSAMANSPPTPALEVPATAVCAQRPSKFRYIGKEGTNIVDGFDITTGRADIWPGRPPARAEIRSHRTAAGHGRQSRLFDATDAKKVPGVVQIVEIPAPPFPLTFLPSGESPVIADNTWAAIQGRNALKIVWDDGPHGIL